jgi:hypothetical protein
MRVCRISLVCIAAAMVPARGHTRGAVAVPSWLKGVTLLYNNDGENLCDVTSPYVMPKPRFTLYSFVNFLAVAVRDKRDRRCRSVIAAALSATATQPLTSTQRLVFVGSQ